MAAHPEDELSVAAVPAAAAVPAEETPGLLVVFVTHQYAYAAGLAAVPAAIVGRSGRGHRCRRGDGGGQLRDAPYAASLVFLPDHREKQRSRAVHDCDIGEFPIAVVRNQRFDNEGKEWVVWDRAHGVV